MSMFFTLKMTTRLAALALLVAGAASTAQGAAPALQGQLTLRPLTPQDIKDYSLTGAQGASGLATIGIGQPAYLDVLVNNAVTNSDITNVTWTLTAAAGSTTTLQASPLGTNVPPFKMADRFNNSGAPVYKVAARQLLRPDVVGKYTVSVLVQSASSGSTNLTQTLTAATYLGIAVCSECHDGGTASDMVTPWSKSGHSDFFTRAVDGLASDHYSKNCISCHNVGYDTNPLAVNGGFDDVAKALGWTFPTVLTNGNWAAMPAELKNVSNIQCENCHGPGSQHAAFNGDISRISVSYGAGDCGQCHDSKNTHYRNAEWNNSTHARVTRTPSGPTRIACVRCHTAGGFADYLEHRGNSATYATNTVYEAITCAACHDPHDGSNPHQLRGGPSITLDCGAQVANAGSGALCMNCHQSRTGSVTNSLVKYPLGQFTYPGGSSFGPHDNPAADILMGVNGYTYGKEIPSSAHRFAVTNTCAGCHMQTIAATDAAFTKVGGHTFGLSYNAVSGGKTNTVELVAVCTKCHGPMESFDLVKIDYNGDGVTEGVQTEVQNLLNRLSTYMPNSTYRADGNYVGDGLVKSSMSVKTNWQAKYLQAAWNFQLVMNDASKGIHNAAYSVGLLKASIADLNGDANNDTLPDAWQTQYFGSPNNPSAAPNATPAGDGIPNWLKYSLGLDPTIPGAVVPDGVVWANGTTLGGSTNNVRIYTAAEVAFDTQVGVNYQIQATGSLSGGWKNIGNPIAGTGKPVSYVTPTRQNVQQFYRVQQNP